VKKPKVYIGYVHGGTVTHGFSFSLLRTSTWVGAEYVPVVTPLHSGVVIATHRNKLMNMFLDSGCDYWLSADTDACWSPEALNKLLAHDVPIVAGHAVGMDYDNDRQFEAILDYDEQGDLLRRPEVGKGLTKVGAVGMHFTLIRRDVCAALAPGKVDWPFSFSTYRNEKAQHSQSLGEDATFCIRAKLKGDFDTYADYDCPIGHIKLGVVWPEGTPLDPRAPREMGVMLGESQMNARYASHLPALMAVVEATTGPILEVGTGLYSTPYLHKVSEGGRLVVSVENHEEWFAKAEKYASENHRVLSEIPQEPERFDVALIDQDPEALRRGSLESLRPRITYAVVHDTEPTANAMYVWGMFLDSFAYRRDFQPPKMPWTTIVSDTSPVPEIP